jgi:hypothetical protein
MTAVATGWHAVTHHKLIDLAVMLVVAAAIAVTLVLTRATADTTGGAVPTSHPQLAPACNRAAVTSFC